jgi:hypothetical protein
MHIRRNRMQNNVILQSSLSYIVSTVKGLAAAVDLESPSREGLGAVPASIPPLHSVLRPLPGVQDDPLFHVRIGSTAFTEAGSIRFRVEVRNRR